MIGTIGTRMLVKLIFISFSLEKDIKISCSVRDCKCSPCSHIWGKKKKRVPPPEVLPTVAGGTPLRSASVCDALFRGSRLNTLTTKV